MNLYGKAFSALKPKQRIYSMLFSGFLLDLVRDNSFRDSASLINKAMHRKEGEEVSFKTLEEYAERTGAGINEVMETLACQILQGYGIDAEDGLVTEVASIPDAARRPVLPETLAESELQTMTEEYNGKHEDRREHISTPVAAGIEKTADDCCYISVDGILVKAQKDSREYGSKRESKFIENTVVHVQCGDKSYRFTAPDMLCAFRVLMAFLLSNNLMENTRLVFISDGARAIKEHVQKYFGFRQYYYFPDWFHLEKKCDQLMSMGIKGTMDEKREIKDKLTGILWAGNVEGAKSYVGKIEKKHVKSQKQLDDLCAYLDRKKDDIPCYALRSMAGVRNSSNPVEKANDIIVAQRQKHNGMSWSRKGSSALATITATCSNGEMDNWLSSGKIEFKMVA